jgi:hypothetical protein
LGRISALPYIAKRRQFATIARVELKRFDLPVVTRSRTSITLLSRSS